MRVSIDSLFGEDRTSPNIHADFDSAAIIREAHAVVAVDLKTDSLRIIFGKSLLQEIANSSRVQPLAVLEVELDMETDDLEKLTALVLALKGSVDEE